MLRLAHVSDLHVLSPAGVQLRRVLFNKRMTGYANLLMKRARVYRSHFLQRVLEAAARESDHVIVTGDVTNLSLEGEYAEANRLLCEVARTSEVTVVPGNHDVYLPAIVRERRFVHHFAGFMESDLPGFGMDHPGGRFPTVKLRGEAAIIGLSTAVPRPPFVSAGILGREQLESLSRLLQHPEVARRTPVILLHHSPFDARLRLEQLRGGLVDASALREVLQPLARGLVLFGHVHVRRHARIATLAGALDAVCATAAALDHPDPRVRSGFNVYELDDDGAIASIRTRVLDAAGEGFETHEIPLREVRP